MIARPTADPDALSLVKKPGGAKRGESRCPIGGYGMVEAILLGSRTGQTKLWEEIFGERRGR